MDWFDTIQHGITPSAAGVWTLVLMVAGHLLREWRATRKLSLEDRLARRDGYARQVSDLLQENRKLREEMHQMNENHELYRQICHKENDQLRQMLLNVQYELEGLKRKLVTEGLEVAKIMGAGREL